MSHLNWQEVDSRAITHEAYDVDAEFIYVRFTGGSEYAYEDCPPPVWKEFTAPGQSRGKYINDVLRYKPNHEHND